jgi:predicted nuclease with RNAse H fold
MVITAGIDLATEPPGTAVATIHWSSGAATVTSLQLGVDDDGILDAAAAADKLGLDCPLGWPDDFLRFVHAHHTDRVVAPQDVAGRDWRRQLAYRGTDRAVRAATGLTPLSVAADRIGLTAMRAAGLLARLASEGRPVDRAGSGVVVEVYPAASLLGWHLPSRGCKGNKNRPQLATLLERLRSAAPWLDLREHAALCADSDDALDAVVAALTSRAAALSQVTEPTDDSAWALARREGWIALPTGPLSDLVVT